MNRVLWDSTKEEKKKGKGIGGVKEVRHHKKQCHKKKKRESTFQFSAIEWSILSRLIPSSTKKKKKAPAIFETPEKSSNLNCMFKLVQLPPISFCVCVCVCLLALPMCECNRSAVNGLHAQKKKTAGREVTFRRRVSNTARNPKPRIVL